MEMIKENKLTTRNIESSNFELDFLTGVIMYISPCMVLGLFGDKSVFVKVS
ncbi:hypothetical protein MUO71_07010 [Candidatus Bathyarchaeota archaeon]|nr:hypothetical protein [Candidatus Bathyarchaeota archaeon]